MKRLEHLLEGERPPIGFAGRNIPRTVLCGASVKYVGLRGVHGVVRREDEWTPLDAYLADDDGTNDDITWCLACVAAITPLQRLKHTDI